MAQPRRDTLAGEPSADVRFDDTGLVVVETPGEDGTYRIPGPGREPNGARRSLPLSEALHAPIRPVGTAENVLRMWVQGAPVHGAVSWDDPAIADPVRVRAGSVVIRDGRILLIGFERGRGTYYEIPGGGVEAGETPRGATARELWEETRLEATVGEEVARVWKDGRREHYFRVDAEGEIGPLEELDTGGGFPVWLPVDQLADTPVWPRRLAWRITHWYRNGWPTRPIELADSIHDLRAPCTW